MGLITAATIASAITTGQAAAPPPTAPDKKPHVNKLVSELMSSDRFMIRLTLQAVEVSRDMDAVIHTALLRSFKHDYHL